MMTKQNTNNSSCHLINQDILFDSKFLVFRVIEEKPKTKVYGVYTKEKQRVESAMLEQNVCLGEIKWYPNWRQYSFFPEYGCVFEKTCMNDITRFMIQLMNDRKQQKGDSV